jgi:hypothetical protein
VLFLQNHTCRPKALDAPCPICLDPAPMFGSQSPADMLPCGHFAHRKCIDISAPGSSCKACSGHVSFRAYSSSDRLSSSRAAAGAAAAAASSSRDYSAEFHIDHKASHISSGYVRDMMELLGGSFEGFEAAEVESMLRELERENFSLLPTREVKVSLAVLSQRASNLCACSVMLSCGTQLCADL